LIKLWRQSTAENQWFYQLINKLCLFRKKIFHDIPGQNDILKWQPRAGGAAAARALAMAHGKALLLGLVLVLAVKSTRPEPVVAAACGGVPLSCAPSCGSAITAALNGCSAAGGGIVQLRAGVYHLNDSLISSPDLSCLIKLDGLSNVVLAGAGGAGRGPDPTATSTLLIHGLRGAIWVHNSTNIRFEHLDIDMARVPYTFGKCTAVTPASMTLQFDPQKYSFEGDLQPWQMQVSDVNEFDTGNWRMNGSTGLSTLRSFLPIELDGPHQLTLRGLGSMQGLRVGKWYVLRNTYYGTAGFSCANTSSIELDHVTMWSAPGMGFSYGTTRDIHMVDTAVMRRPGWALSACADASHFNECGGHIHLERFRAEGQGDDGMNVHGMFHDVRSVDSDYAATLGGESVVQLTLGNRPAGTGTELTLMAVGARYEFRNRRTFAIEGIGVLRSCAAMAPATSRLQKAVFEMQAGVTISQYALLSNADMEPSVHIIDSYFGNSKCRGTLLKTSNVLVENTLYNHTGMHCVEAWPDGCFWFESNGFRNWTLRNNTFNGCLSDNDGPAEGGTSDVFVAACAPSFDNITGEPLTAHYDSRYQTPITVGQPFADGALEGNRFIQHGGKQRTAIELVGFDGLRVVNNTITMSGSSVDPSTIGVESAFGTMKSVGGPPHGHGGITGSLDGFTVHVGPGVDPEFADVSGWIYDPLLANKSVISNTIQIELDRKIVWTAVANDTRMDLAPYHCTQTSLCPFGYGVGLPGDVVDRLTTGNHTLAVYALRPASSGLPRYLIPMAESYSGLACITPERRECTALGCRCGSPLPPPPPPPPPTPRVWVSSSVRCVLEGNMCEGGPCSTSDASGCVPPAQSLAGYVETGSVAHHTSEDVIGLRGPCPCPNPAHCRPIQGHRYSDRREIFVFNAVPDNWRAYDWDRITTVATYGGLSNELLCHAHSVGVRVVWMTAWTWQWMPMVNLANATARSAWVDSAVQTAVAMHVDGINVHLGLLVNSTSCEPVLLDCSH
jgi:hypothetical protein